jgi:hypothetical protein
MRIMHMQNIMDAPIPEEMAKLPPLTAVAADTSAEPPTVQPAHAESTPEAANNAATPAAASFKIPKLSKPQPIAGTRPSEKTRREEPPQQKSSPGGDEAMAVDLDLEVSDEDRKFVESPAPDNIDKMLDDFIGDKKSPVKNALKPSLKKPEDTVKKPTGTAGKKLSFVDDPPKSALGLMAAALKKASKSNKADSRSDEAEMRHLVKTLSSAQRAAFRKMLTSTVPSPKRTTKKSRK